MLIAAQREEMPGGDRILILDHCVDDDDDDDDDDEEEEEEEDEEDK